MDGDYGKLYEGNLHPNLQIGIYGSEMALGKPVVKTDKTQTKRINGTATKFCSTTTSGIELGKIVSAWNGEKIA